MVEKSCSSELLEVFTVVQWESTGWSKARSVTAVLLPAGLSPEAPAAPPRGPEGEDSVCPLQTPFPVDVLSNDFCFSLYSRWTFPYRALNHYQWHLEVLCTIDSIKIISWKYYVLFFFQTMKTSPPVDMAPVEWLLVPVEKEQCLIHWRMMDDDGWHPLRKWIDHFRGKTFSSAAGWSFSLDSNMRTPAWISEMILNLESVVVHKLVVVTVVQDNWSEMQQLFLDWYFIGLIVLTMRGPATLAAVPGLCSLVICLCVVSQTCYGNHSPPNPEQDPRPSLPEATRLSSSHVDKLKSPSNRSISIGSRTLLKPRLTQYLIILTTTNTLYHQITRTIANN